MQDLYILHHLGLGDHFICNGLVRTLIAQHKPCKTYLAVKSHNLTTVKQMYADVTTLNFIIINNYDEVNNYRKEFNPIVAGYENTRQDWDVSFYDSVNIAFAKRWDAFKIFRDYTRENCLKSQLNINNKYYLVHNRTSCKKEFTLNIHSAYKPIILTEITGNLLDWCGVIEEAEEVHCIESSVLHLAQSLKVKKGYFYCVRNKEVNFKLSSGWQIIK